MAKDLKTGLPNPMAPDEIKKSEAFGLKVGKAILALTDTYREKRNKKFKTLREFAEGRQPVEPYLDQMMIDGNKPVADIFFKAVPIAKKFENIVVDGYMSRRERPKVTALSKDVQDRKDRRRAEAKFRMEFNPVIQQISQEAGVPLEDPDAFVPEDNDDLEIHFHLNDREIEETLMQKAISFVINDNDIEELKRRFLSDIFQVNLAGIYEYMDRNGRERLKYIPAEDSVYDVSVKPDFSDARYMGHFERMSISEIRSYFNVSREKEILLFKAAKSRYNLTYSWDSRWEDCDERPYDYCTFEILFYWWKCSKGIKYIEGEDRWGKAIFDVSDSIELGKDTTRKKTGVTYAQTAYEGVIISGTDIVLEWGEQKNVLRKGEDKEEVLSPYRFYMPDNRGDMLVPSAVDKIIPNIMAMDVAVMKLNHIIAQLAPDGYLIDVAGLSTINLGQGWEDVGMLELVSIRNQTGNMYWSSKGEDGETQNQPPILPTQSAAPSKIIALIENYNFNLNCIRDYLGVNEARDGSSIAPRTGYRVLQASLDSSNTATYNIYRAWTSTMSKVCFNIGTRVWDSLLYSENPNKGFVGILGRNNVELIKRREDITRSSYDYVFELEMEGTQKEELEQSIQTALAAGTLTLDDALLVREIYDYKVAAKQLRYLMRKREKENFQRQVEIQRATSEANAMAAQAAEQAKQQTIQIELQMKSELARMEAEAQKEERFERFVYDSVITSLDPTKPLPEYLAPSIQQVIMNRLTNVEAEIQEKQQAILDSQQMQQPPVQ